MNTKEKKEKITFSFGENWIDFLEKADESTFKTALKDIEDWFPEDMVKDATVLDMGSGSGIHSLGFLQLGAQKIISVDYDKKSVEATIRLWNKFNKPDNWKIFHGSALDKSFLSDLGLFDIVYSWGVLHHTGSMWDAIGNCMNNVKSNGYFLLSIYTKGEKYQYDLNLKKRYNKSSSLGKRWMEWKHFILPLMLKRLRWGVNPFAWNEIGVRGMLVYNDIKDWLGGLPYEVASGEEIKMFFIQKNFELIKMQGMEEGYCSIYLFRKK